MNLSFKNILLWVSGLFGLLVFVFSFIAGLKVTATTAISTSVYEYKSIVWGVKEFTYTVNGVSNVVQIGRTLSSTVGIVGAIFVFVAAIAAVVFSFVVLDNEVVQKVIMFASALFMVVGGILCFFTLNGFKACFNSADASAIFDGAKVSCALPIVSGILGILGGGAIVASQVIPER